MRQNWRTNRVIFLVICLLICVGLIVLSSAGVLRPLEGILTIPYNFVTRLFTQSSLFVSDASGNFVDVETLLQRNAELEEQLALVQAEVIQLREIASDYERLTGLLEYTTSVENQEFLTADVIGVDQLGVIRSVIINRGTRDGIAVGMPVVTQLGLVGRVMQVSANASRVQMISDQNSSISARLQTTRAEGSVIGLLTGNLRMTFIPLDREIVEGDLVITSGLGGNFPPDIVVGQVTSRRSFEFELYQEAEVRSLIDFDTLEFVLVITSFEPADLSVFDEEAS